MALSEVIRGKKDSKIYSLKKGKETKGFRVKIFNDETRKFVYYDFALSTLGSNEKLKNYLVKNFDNFEELQLKVDTKDNLLKTDDEINRSIEVISFADVNEATKVVSQIVKIDEVRDELEKILDQIGK